MLHDGPPYPTGEIHLGTGLNKILKDHDREDPRAWRGITRRTCPAGIATACRSRRKVEKELGGKGKVPPAEFRRLCREFAARYVEQHKRDFKRLGVFGRWNDPYLTMNFDTRRPSPALSSISWRKATCIAGRKPVYWCMYDRTALAEAEVEYEDHTSPSIWVKFA